MLSKTKVLIVGTMSFVVWITAFTSYSVVASNMISDLDLSYLQSGLLMSIFAVAYAMMQIPSGVLSDKWGGRSILQVATIILGLSSLAFYFVDRFETALALRFLMGASSGFIMPACIKLISVSYEPHNREKALGIFGLGQGAGSIVAFTVIPAIMVLGSYRWGTVFVAIFCLVLASIVLLTLKKGDSKESTNSHFLTKTQSRVNLKGILNRRMIALILINFSGAAVQFGILTWVPIYLLGILQGPYVQVGLVSATFGLANLLGSYSGALSAERWGAKNTIVVSMLMSAVLPFAIICFDQVVIIILVMALLGWCAKLYFAPTWALIPSSVEKGHEGRAFGVFNTLSFLGAFFAPTLVGYTLDRTVGYAVGFLVISLIAIPGLVASLLLGKLPVLKQARQEMP